MGLLATVILLFGFQAQTIFAGFGMRYAVLSGVMSAHALLNAVHYDAVWRREIGPAIETSVVNRAVYSLLGNRGYRWLLRSQAWTGDARSFLRWLYGTASVHRVLAGVGLLTRYCSVISWPARC